MSLIKNLFKTETAKEKVQKWCSELRSESRQIERQLEKIKMEERKVTLVAKQAAKRNDMETVRILSREIVNSRKATKRLLIAKTQISSVSMQLQQQLARAKLSGSIQKSSEVMKGMNQLIQFQGFNESLKNLAMEMQRAGIIDEMINDTLDDVLNEGIDENEVDDEVQKVINEVVQKEMEGARTKYRKLPEPEKQETATAEDENSVSDLMEKFLELKNAI